MNLAPVIIFVYNRPWHTRQVLESLKANTLAGNSKLYIFSDGAKKNAGHNEISWIQEVRELIREDNWCGEVEIIEREQNLGLAQSVISGVSEIISDHGKVIVLEDDLILGKYFLEFLNDGLNEYDTQKEIYGISGYKFQSIKKIQESTFFLPLMSSWGYGTWADRWNSINFSARALQAEINSRHIGKELDFGNIPFYNMLQDQVKGKIDSWAICFYASMFLKKGVFLFPNTSLLRNIGFDGTGIHSGSSIPSHYNSSEKPDEKIEVKRKAVILEGDIVENIKKGTYHSEVKRDGGIMGFLKRRMPPEFIQFARRKLNREIKHPKNEYQFPRYTRTKKQVLGKEFDIPDLASFNFMYREIFVHEIYKFYTGKKAPYIIDGGANIGLSTTYFKKLYPHSKIIAFEPDPEIFEFLRVNIDKFNYKEVNLVNKGLWDKEGELDFWSEGADGGLFTKVDSSNKASVKIETVSLKRFLNQEVDLLKLDIEGAETVVLKDIQHNLDKVKRIFIEYHSFKDKPQNLDEVLNILISAGFRFHINSPGISSKSPFVKLNTYNNMDMQLNIYAFKIY
ncbi:methyltransferase, FkbM family [Salinimicrobium sediminis]|uniref:Methyltransferase, FkbM family n=1 Tax=Salinimicrobium sediminis TaxID=1343891 RepID=A0A285WZQ5_9FLAO|nr:FkbM family methyltransferase [Salinimicrobium sediminis]SOC78573.1 methyltransferase, FkbM family [Salinimicrobium sediminis]